MILLKFLQQNAEWMCTIAIVGFTAVQVILAYQQNLQNIKLKRLELANSLDKIAAIFLGEREEAKQVVNWLISNASNFIFLLNKKDRESYKKLLAFLYNFKNNPAISGQQKEESIREFLNLVSEIDSALGNANYGFVNESDETKELVKNDR